MSDNKLLREIEDALKVILNNCPSVDTDYFNGLHNRIRQRLENDGAQTVPVEPEGGYWTWTRDGMVQLYETGEYVSKHDYDSLQVALQLAQEERDKNAPIINQQIMELIKNPPPELLKKCGRRLLRFQETSTDDSFTELQWAEVKQDASRVLAELYSEILKDMK